MGAVVLICGTGTEIGKTHFSVALLKRAGRNRTVLGFKPVESGCEEWAAESDHTALAAASTFHVKHPPVFCLREPISPHLAARHEGRNIDLGAILEKIESVAHGPELLLVETAGGLFSPLNESSLNADLARDLQRRLPQTRTVLIAPDRLGVLHDLGATVRASIVADVTLDGIVLSSPARPDASTGLNGSELKHFVSIPLLGTLPRCDRDEMAEDPSMLSIYSSLLNILSLPASIR